MWAHETVEYGSAWSGQPVHRFFFDGRRWRNRILFDIGRPDDIEPIMSPEQARAEVERRMQIHSQQFNGGSEDEKQKKIAKIEGVVREMGEASTTQVCRKVDLNRRTVAQYLKVDKRFRVSRIGDRREIFYALR